MRAFGLVTVVWAGLASLTAAQQLGAPQQSLDTIAEAVLLSSTNCAGRLTGEEELLIDTDFALYPFNVASEKVEKHQFTPEEVTAFQTKGGIPADLHSKWQPNHPWLYNSAYALLTPAALKKQAEIEAAVAAGGPAPEADDAGPRCEDGMIGPDYDSFEVLNPGVNISTVQFTLIQTIDLAANASQIDAGFQRALVKSGSEFDGYSTILMTEFLDAHGNELHSDKVFTNIDGDKSGYTVPAGTRSMRVGYGVDMAYFDAETRQGVCFSPISVIISQFKSKSLVGMSDNFLISYYVLIIVCLVNSICIPIALLWGRQNKLAQFTPLNLVYPWTSENSWVLGLMFMSMLSTAFYIIKSYKTFVHLKGYAVVAYPILLIPFLCLVGAFYFAEFVAFHQVQRFQRRSAALLGVWATFCRLLFEFFTLMVAVAAFYESAFVGNLPTDGSTTFFQIAENMPVVLAELLLVCWFLKKALALGHVDYHVDQSGVAGPLKMSFEKDFAYVRELLNNSEQKKRELDIVTARKMRLPEPSLLDNLKSFGKKKDEKKPEGPSKSLVAKILAPFHTLLLKPYREMDSRFRILWILAGWAIWVTMIEYVSLVNSFKEDLGCQASRFTLLVEMVDRAGKFYPAKPADSDPNYLSLTNNSYVSFARTLMKLLEAASAIGIVVTLLSVLTNLRATSEDAKARTKAFAQGKYPAGFTKAQAVSANVNSLARITGRLVAFILLGAVSFFAVFFLVLLFIFWGAAILSYSSVARKWLRENEKLWILVTAIVVNIVWGRFQNWVVLKAFTVDGIHMKFKSGFYVWEFIVMFSNAASALNSFLFRFVISILSTFFYMGRMDTQTVHGYLSAFSGYGAYTQYVYASYVYKNPVKNAFLALLMKVDEKEMTSVSSRRGDLESGPEYSRHSAKAYEVHTVGARKSTVGRKRLARKLWVAYFIHKNPSLRFYRKQHLTTLLDNVGKE